MTKFNYTLYEYAYVTRVQDCPAVQQIRHAKLNEFIYFDNTEQLLLLLQHTLYTIGILNTIPVPVDLLITEPKLTYQS